VPAPTAWWFEHDPHGLTAHDQAGLVGRVDVQDTEAEVKVVFSLTDRVPHGMATELARGAFAHPALEPDRTVAVSLPQGEVDVLAEVRRHLWVVQTHVAGATCLVEGRVRGR
ncbi:Hypothetical protein KLENKIAIHU_4926, partial [Klenkia terrae]